MKKLFLIALGLALLASFGMAQENEKRSTDPLPLHTVKKSGNSGKSTCSLQWTMDIEAITGDPRCLGVEFDGTNIWVTGASDSTIANLYKISPGGTLLDTYAQPPANWGNWGWRDLAFDGQYLYAGDETNAPNHITQIDPSNGQPTGVYYGPFPVNPCRALAYDPVTDSFWTACWNSLIYQCFRDN